MGNDEYYNYNSIYCGVVCYLYCNCTEHGYFDHSFKIHCWGNRNSPRRLSRCQPRCNVSRKGAGTMKMLISITLILLLSGHYSVHAACFCTIDINPPETVTKQT